MDAYTFDIFVMHSIAMENTEENGINTTTCELLEIGPLNGPDINNLESIKALISNISSTPVIHDCGQIFLPGKTTMGFFEQAQNCQCIP